MEKETLISIAKRTNCSVSTVSRVLNGKAKNYRISQKTADYILEEAKRCNYVPSILAKGLRTNKTDTIGLLIPSIENAFFANIAGVIIREARRFNYKVVVVDTQEDVKEEEEGLSALLARHVDGILAVPCGISSESFLRIKASGLPVVLVDRFLTDTNELSYVTTDNYLGATKATEYLIENGHKRIFCIQGPPYSMPVKERIRGYLDTLKKYSLESHAMISGDSFTIQNGYIETKLALNMRTKPTAIFALSNTILLGAIKAIQESGMLIPDDISLVSYDDNLLFNYLNPAITCINQASDKIATFAVKILMKMIRKEENETTHLYFPPSLIVRRSVKDLLQ